MEISSQIKKYRFASNLSQEELAEKVYVTRQTISNWENDKNYPDINSLVLLSTLFDVSLDILVKGDLEKMKEQVQTEDVKKFKNDGGIFSILLIVTVLLAIPMFLFLEVIGIILWVLLYGVTMYYAIRVEKQKKKFNVQTYREILAFTEGKKLDEIEQSRERKKRRCQPWLYALASAVVTILICLISIRILM